MPQACAELDMPEFPAAAEVLDISEPAAVPAAAEKSLKINSINFDNSDSIIFLGAAAENTSNISITKKSLTEPDRVYFDIENAVLAFPAREFEFQNSRLKQVKIAQNSLSPDIVRIVITSAPNYNTSDINVLNIKNNIIIKLGSEKPLQQYLTQVYKETKESAIEYYDKAVILMEGGVNTEAGEIFNSVQRAFSIDGQELVRPNIEQKQARLKSRFFLEDVIPNKNGVLLSGIGVINLEKPFILSEPSRVVFDLPNTIVKQELRDKELKLSEAETVRIGQFEPSKARIVIKTSKPEEYAAIYGSNLQTLLIKKGVSAEGIIPAPEAAELISFNSRSIDEKTEEVNILFGSPAVYSIKRLNGRLQAVFYNLKNFDYQKFNAAALKDNTGFNAVKTGASCYILEFPENSVYLADCYEALNASQLRFVLTKIGTAGSMTPRPVIPAPEISKEKPSVKKHEKKPSSRKKKKEEQLLLQKLNSRPIVIDPGHGGGDTGAMRGDILEKDLTLAIAVKVRECLIEKGITNIIMTRENDTYLTLDERVQIANVHDTSIYVSIHINASVKSEINGIETHYYTENGYNAAQVLHKELMSEVNAADRGLFKSRFYVIKNTEAPAVLLELGFISNDAERNALVSEQRQRSSARAIAEGIFKFLTEYQNGQ